jgi:hypothetical protein
MGNRRPQVVGSIAQPDIEQAISWQLERLPGLRYVSGGETGDRKNWIVPFIESLRDHPDLEVAQEGRWGSYEDLLVHRVKPGHKLAGSTMSLGTLERTREELEVLDRLTADLPERPTLLVGIPDYLNLALFSMGKLGPVKHRKPFLDMVVNDITETQKAFGDRVIFQLEAPLHLVATAKAGPLSPVVAGVMAERLVKVALRAPEGTRFGVHLCLGDLNHEALSPMKSAAPVVHLYNELSSRWPADRPLEFIHAPLAGGREPLSTNPKFYETFRNLYRDGTARFVAGVVQEEQDEADQLVVLKLIEQMIGPVDVATYCGLGRRSPEAADAAAERTMRLIEASARV